MAEDNDLFADLVPFKARLNDASVKANQALKAAKERLKSLSLGVEAWVTLEAEYDQALYRSSTVSFGYAFRRLGDNPDFPETEPDKGARWDLWIEWEEESEAEGYHFHENPTPVLSCSRELRIAAARTLPRLVLKLKENAETAIREVEESAKRFGPK